MAEIFDWDTVAANNNSAAPNGWPEGMAYNTVNDAGREDQAVVARDLADTDGSLTTEGSTSALTLTSVRTISSLFRGLKMAFRSHVNSSGALTLNLNGLGAVSLQNPDGSAPQLLINSIYEVVHDGTRWQMLSTTGRGQAQLNSVNRGVVASTYTLVADDLNDKLVRLSGDLIVPSGLFTAAGTKVIWHSIAAFDITNNTGASIFGNGTQSPSIFNGTTVNLNGGFYTLINLDSVTRILLSGVI